MIEISDALHCGSTEDALDCLEKVSADGSVSPLQISARLILALVKSTRMADLIENLNWKPEVRAFEAALAEATRRVETSLC